MATVLISERPPTRRVRQARSSGQRGLRPVPAPDGAADADLLRALLGADETAFCRAVDALHAPMLRFASCHVASAEAAEQAVMDAWGDVLGSIDGFFATTSVRVWLYRRLTRAARRVETAEVSAGSDCVEPTGDGGGPDPAAALRDAIVSLPRMERQVVTLRDIDRWTSAEVCELLEISPETERRLLHRARTVAFGVLHPRPQAA